MQALFIGGIKNGKSKSAEEYILQHAITKPTYLATTEFFDEEMHEAIRLHKLQRGDNFTTLEESLHLHKATQNQDCMILVECISMWINNMLYHEYSEEDIFEEIKLLTSSNKSFVFVINDVSCSVVSENALTRKFVNINGKVSQLLASTCKEVFRVTAGIAVKIK